ncbi:hypothetical protein N9Y92_04460, partial [Chlamydiales bacterium]|nr:hypothetical protein [Chlamydiales bacterium]
LNLWGGTMNKTILSTFVLGFIYFFYVPETAYCECKKCSARATELRKKLFEEERAKDIESYDTSELEWGQSDKDISKKEPKAKKSKSKKKKKSEKTSK